MLSEYIAYLYSFLNRKSPNNGSKPISWERFSAEWLAEDGDDYDKHMRFECRQSNFV